MNMDIWVVGTSNQLIVTGPLPKLNPQKKVCTCTCALCGSSIFIRHFWMGMVRFKSYYFRQQNGPLVCFVLKKGFRFSENFQNFQ